MARIPANFRDLLEKKAFARKYLGQDTHPYRRPGELRVMIEIAPERVQTMG